MNHLEILRNEHLRLQTKYAELQRRYDILEANFTLKWGKNENDDFINEDDKSFVKRLVDTIIQLYDKNLYRLFIIINFFR